MLPDPMFSFLAREHQRELLAEAERSRLIKEALQDGRAVHQGNLRTRLGKQLISWGTRLQTGTLSMQEPRQSPCVNG